MSIVSISNYEETKASLSPALKRNLTIAILAGLHFVLYVIAGVAEFNTSGFIFRSPSYFHGLWVAVMAVLEFPLVTICKLAGIPETDLFLVVFIINSFLWAGIIYSAYKLFKRKKSE